MLRFGLRLRSPALVIRARSSVVRTLAVSILVFGVVYFGQS